MCVICACVRVCGMSGVCVRVLCVCSLDVCVICVLCVMCVISVCSVCVLYISISVCYLSVFSLPVCGVCCGCHVRDV